MTTTTRTILKWVILTALMSYAVWVTIWAHAEAAKHVCTGVEIVIDGPQRIDSVMSSGVRAELNRYPDRLVGTPLNLLNTVKVERFLESLHNFESVNCMISPSGQLVVHIVPLVPVMRVFSSDQSYYINKDGKYIESNAEFYADVPVVQGRFSRSFTPRAVLPLVRMIDNDPMLKGLVSMIEARDARNLILVPRIQGHVINFGDTTRLEEKKRALTLFYREVMPYKGWQEYDTISVKFRDQIVATRRIKPVAAVKPETIEEVDLEEATLPDAGETGAVTTQQPATPE